VSGGAVKGAERRMHHASNAAGVCAVSTGTFVHEGEGCLEVAWSLRNFADNAQQVLTASLTLAPPCRLRERRERKRDSESE
jgi:hypothetical protein